MIDELRKIVKSGNTSFTIALPIDWIRKNNLSKGSDVKIVETQIGDLLLSSESRRIEPKTDILTIKIDNKDNSAIDFELTQGYIRDYQTIIIEGKELKMKLNHILGRINEYIGFGVIEQSVTHLTIKNFFNLDKETSPHMLTKKMSMGNRSFFNLLEQFFIGGLTKADVLESQRLREQNERLFKLIRKSILKVFEQPQLMKTIQTTPLDLLKDKIIALNLKNMAVLLDSLVKTLLFIETKKKETGLLKSTIDKMNEEYTQVVNAINTGRNDILKEYVRKNSVETNNLETMLRDIDHPLIIECVHNIKMCRNLLVDIANQIIE